MNSSGPQRRRGRLERRTLRQGRPADRRKPMMPRPSCDCAGCCTHGFDGIHIRVEHIVEESTSVAHGRGERGVVYCAPERTKRETLTEPRLHDFIRQQRLFAARIGRFNGTKMRCGIRRVESGHRTAGRGPLSPRRSSRCCQRALAHRRAHVVRHVAARRKVQRYALATLDCLREGVSSHHRQVE